jgi:hypothetical protein
MPVASATAEMSFSVLGRLKTYARSTMKNDRLSSLRLVMTQWVRHLATSLLKFSNDKIFSWSRFQRLSCPLAFFYIPGLVQALLQSNNDRVAYIKYRYNIDETMCFINYASSKRYC